MQTLIRLSSKLKERPKRKGIKDLMSIWRRKEKKNISKRGSRENKRRSIRK